MVDKTVVLLISFFLGGLGIDRFYLGRTKTGIAKLLTLGGLGIWWLADLYFIWTEKLAPDGGYE